jgi:hypothetical protein
MRTGVVGAGSFGVLLWRYRRRCGYRRLSESLNSGVAPVAVGRVGEPCVTWLLWTRLDDVAAPPGSPRVFSMVASVGPTTIPASAIRPARGLPSSASAGTWATTSTPADTTSSTPAVELT